MLSPSERPILNTTSDQPSPASAYVDFRKSPSSSPIFSLNELRSTIKTNSSISNNTFSNSLNNHTSRLERSSESHLRHTIFAWYAQGQSAGLGVWPDQHIILRITRCLGGGARMRMWLLGCPAGKPKTSTSGAQSAYPPIAMMQSRIAELEQDLDGKGEREESGIIGGLRERVRAMEQELAKFTR